MTFTADAGQRMQYHGPRETAVTRRIPTSRFRGVAGGRQDSDIRNAWELPTRVAPTGLLESHAGEHRWSDRLGGPVVLS